jgi:glycosyltransferase involved in cell wall biosynthesis
MPKPVHKPRVAVLSPFVDKRHGTERCLAEQIERLAGDYEIHLYSSRVEDIDLGKITWHRVPMPRGPHLFRYVWWLFANWFCRWRDRRFRGLAPDVVYSAGVNCLDADLVSVHVLFSKVRAQLGDGLSLKRNPLKAWPLMLHRRIYYRLIESLEDRLYNQEDITLVAVSQTGAQDIQDRFGRHDRLSVAYHGVDSVKFAPGRRQGLRKGARAALGLSDENFAVLLIGNDWRIKGLRCLLEAVATLRNPLLRVLVVGQDSSVVYQEQLIRLGLAAQVQFLPPRPDVEFYYAAADAYAGPSLEDTFSMPPAEAMSCGIAVIVSRAAGVSEIIHHGEDGLILEDPADFQKLAEWLQRLSQDAEWRRLLGENASRTAGKYTWERNAQQLRVVLDSIIEGGSGQ